MSAKIYMDMRSQPCRALLLFLKHSGIPYEIEFVDLFKGEHQKPAYTAKFPLPTVPALSDGDFHLAETMAIFRYLTNKHAGTFPDNWYPADPKARGRVDEYMAYHHTGTRGAVMPVFTSEVLIPMKTGKKVPKDQVDEELEKMEKGLGNIEKGFLKDNDFLCGSELSFADLLCMSELIQFTVNGRDILAGFPKLKAYVERVKNKLGLSYEEVNFMLYKWRDTFQNM